MRTPILIAALLATALLSGCGSNNTYNPSVIGGSGSFRLAIAPASQTATQGQSATYTATLTAQNGFSSTVDLSVSGLPAGAGGAFNPPSVTPTAGGATSTLTITTSAGQGGLSGNIRSRAVTPPGTYTLTIGGTGGGITQTATAQLVVQAATVPSFTIIAGTSQTVQQGAKATYPFSVKSVNGFAGTVAFSATNLPAGSTALFNPTAVNLTANATVSATLEIQTSASTPAATSTPTIVGTSGTLTNQATETLVVSAAPAALQIFTADQTANRIVRIDDMSGTNWTTFGTTGSGVGQFSNPSAISVASDGRIYIADTGNNRIVRMDDMNGSNWKNFGTIGGGVSQFREPTAVFVAADGRIYIVDRANQRIVRMDDMTGANWTALVYEGDGEGIFVANDQRIYLTQTANSRIRRFDDMTGANPISFGAFGSGGGQFTSPLGVFVGGDGRIYIVDRGNYRIVRMDDMAGTNWTTLGSLGTGTAKFNLAWGIAVGSDSRIYVADRGNHRIVRFDDMSGTNWTAFGTSGSGVGQFTAPAGIFVR